MRFPTIALLLTLLLTVPVTGCATQSPSEPLELRVYLADSATGPQVSQMRQSLRQADNVASVAHVSKEAALRDFKQQLQDEPEVADALTGNPLPASLVVTLKPGSTSDDLEGVIGAVEAEPLFLEIVEGAPDDWLRY